MTDEKFKVGDRVRIVNPTTGGRFSEPMPEWAGLEAEVLEIHPDGWRDDALLKPFSARPDGQELYEFFWSMKELELVKPPIDMEALKKKYEAYGAAVAHFTFEEWCAIYSLIKEAE